MVVACDRRRHHVDQRRFDSGPKDRRCVSIRTVSSSRSTAGAVSADAMPSAGHDSTDPAAKASRSGGSSGQLTPLRRSHWTTNRAHVQAAEKLCRISVRPRSSVSMTQSQLLSRPSALLQSGPPLTRLRLGHAYGHSPHAARRPHAVAPRSRQRISQGTSRLHRAAIACASAAMPTARRRLTLQRRPSVETQVRPL